jgi:hypothetical protein
MPETAAEVQSLRRLLKKLAGGSRAVGLSKEVAPPAEIWSMRLANCESIEGSAESNSDRTGSGTPRTP